MESESQARVPLYVEEKLSLRRKRGRRRRAGSRLVLPPRPTQPDQLWTMDFASDAFTSGRKFRTLNLMDGFTREALEIEPDTSLPGARVVRVLEGMKQQGRKPEAIVIDNGPEFVSQVVDQWAYENKSTVALHHAGATDGERLHRKLQRQVPRRMSERELGFSISPTRDVRSPSGSGTTTTCDRTRRWDT
jgi:transposase InsO family protein